MHEFAVIFDFNGTLLFDTLIQYWSWNSLAEDTLGHGISQEQFIRFANGRTSRETVQYFWGNSLTEQQRYSLIKQKRERYKQFCLAHPEVFHLADGSEKVLNLLKEKNIPFTIATSSNPQSVDFYFNHLHLANWFDREQVICSDYNFKGKPAPDIYLIAAQKLNMPPKKCIVIEDAPAGILAARAAGIGYVIMIDPENSGLADLADQTVQHYNELYELLKKQG